MNIKKFGKNPSGDRIFKNIEPTQMLLKGSSYFNILKEYLHKSKLIAPSRPLPTDKTDLHALREDKPVVVWFGHSSYLIHYQGLHILVDPVLFGPASPLPFGGHPFPGTTIYTSEDFPVIDILIITHDHYDHLSYETLLKLKNKIKKIIVPIGASSHLKYWGFDAGIITELNWHEKADISEEIKITALPARHFSGRFLKKNKTLWVSYALAFKEYKIFIGGDSGYDKQFKIIGDAYGPFDIAFLECGQYGKHWPQIHMFPEQTAQAAADLKTKILLPVHWSKFVLSIHAWNEPVKRLLASASNPSSDIALPMIGEKYVVGAEVKDNKWWDFE